MYIPCFADGKDLCSHLCRRISEYCLRYSRWCTCNYAIVPCQPYKPLVLGSVNVYAEGQCPKILFGSLVRHAFTVVFNRLQVPSLAEDLSRHDLRDCFPLQKEVRCTQRYLHVYPESTLTHRSGVSARCYLDDAWPLGTTYMPCNQRKQGIATVPEHSTPSVSYQHCISYD
jgi:hypothetical protein